MLLFKTINFGTIDIIEILKKLLKFVIFVFQGADGQPGDPGPPGQKGDSHLISASSALTFKGDRGFPGEVGR